jgi:hypothetical protein
MLGGCSREVISELQFSHLALFYTSTQQYLAAVSARVQTSIERREPVCIAAPASRIELLRAGLDGGSAKIAFADMGELGRNPARIIPEMRAFIDDHPGQRVNYMAEMAWAARSAEELREAARHEALINLALADAAATILCAYDAMALGPAVMGARQFCR